MGVGVVHVGEYYLSKETLRATSIVGRKVDVNVVILR